MMRRAWLIVALTLLCLTYIDGSAHAQRLQLSDPIARVSALDFLGALAPSTPLDLAPNDCPARPVDELSARGERLLLDRGGLHDVIGPTRLRLHSAAFSYIRDRNPALSVQALMPIYKSVLERPLEACAVALWNASVNTLVAGLTDDEFDVVRALTPSSTVPPPIAAYFERLSAADPLFSSNGMLRAMDEAVAAVIGQRVTVLRSLGIEL
jgi:hypothetical protein